MGSPINRVSGQYFEATGIPLVAGRAIAPSDQAGTMKVAVINETMARRFFPNGGAVGRSVKINIDAVAGPWHWAQNHGQFCGWSFAKGLC